jgi:replicative DNA helicase
VTANPQTALNEWQATGLESSDLGKWSYLPHQVLSQATPTEPLDVNSVPGGIDLVGDDRNPDADPIADVAFSLNRDKFSADLQQRLSSAIADIQAGGDPAAVCERVVRAVASVRDGRSNNRGDRTLTQELPPLLEALSSGATLSKPVPTGIAELDAVIYGWQPTLCLIGADPGVGKSATMVKSAYSGAMAGHKSAFFSLEDPPRFISTRLVSFISRVEVLRILYSKLTKEELELVESALEELGRVSDRIIVFDGSERPMAVERLCATARSLISSSAIECVYVDHAGELSSSARDRHDLEVSSQLSLLRGLANSTGIPVVVAMHMRRRLNAKPTLADFANSSGAERKARLALALTREPNADAIQIHILKQTNGPSGITVDAKFDKISGTVA